MEQETLDKFHLILIEILDEFVKTCNDNNLTYFLEGGTLLGAVRHKGFIPWDDDIDIAMPRDDYDKFIDIIMQTPNKNYYIISYKSPVNTFFHYKAYAKFCKKGTLISEFKEYPKKHTGIFIDIFPFDNCLKLFTPIQIKLLSNLRWISRIGSNWNIPRSKYKRFFQKIIKTILPKDSINRLLKQMYSLFNKFNTNYICFFSTVERYKKNTHKYDSIFPLSKLIFEGKEYNVPRKHDEYLKQLYGDYMKLPAIEKRVTHNYQILNFNNTEFSVEKMYKINV